MEKEFYHEEKRARRPELERYSDIPLFNTKAVVRQTGITAPTLRAWERRYTILAPERAQNTYRLYSEHDIAIIRWLKERIDEGMSISQAIALFHHLEDEYHTQFQPKTLLPEETSSFQMPSSTLPMGEHPLFVASEVQEVKEASPQVAPPSMQKRDIEIIAGLSPNIYHMQFAQKYLLEAFYELDEATASRLMASMLAIYSVEQVCSELITPTLWKIGELWEQGLLAVPIEHFASAFFHSLLTNLFHAMPTNNMNPLVLACSAPGEVHELAPLMLSLLLRRVGLHVAYLGQSIETEGLLQIARQLSPTLICISVTLVSCLEAATELGQKVQQLPPPRPVLIFGGQAFEQHTDLRAHVPGVYLKGDMQIVIPQLRHMAFQQSRPSN